VKDEDLTRFFSSGMFSALDAHFAALLTRLNRGHVPELSLAAALVSKHTRQGHVCLDLRELGGKLLENDPEGFRCPDASAWCEKLMASYVVGNPGTFRPLILDEQLRLYLYRYWEYQHQLAEALTARISGPSPKVGADSLKDQLERLFPSGGGDGVDWQKVGAFAAVWKTFCVISGGPGTGKTTTVAKILALLLQQAPSDNLRIALTAPTGKAAARLQEALRYAREKLECPESIRQAIPETASTIHRLLGTVHGSPYFRHNAGDLLPVDVVVVDEASMVDLALMSKLFQALPLTARVILLGDKDQLSSVEAGAVLGDICETGERAFFSKDFAKALRDVGGGKLDAEVLGEDPAKRPKDCIIQLQKSYRFADESGISLLSQAIRNSETDTAITLLGSGKYDDLNWNEMPSAKVFGKAIKNQISEGFRDYFQAVERIRLFPGGDPAARIKEVFDLFERFRILCAVREGFCGVAALNSAAENIFEEQQLLQKETKWYVGRPILIGRNDYNLRLFNGDVGIFLPDLFSGTGYRVFFPGQEETFRAFHPLRLPEHETVYAMTVHKSQGSEFNRVIFILPDRDSPVLTRELVYTAITRAKEKVSLWGSESTLRAAVSRSTKRMSGLSDALWRSCE
jgi:exodeoxyribonuclease V alpha subunit